MKIYVAVSGCYSDYGIDAIFHHKKDAEAYIKDSKYKDNDPDWDDGPRIEDWELMEAYEKVPMPAGCNTYCVFMLRDGTVQDYSSRTKNSKALLVELQSLGTENPEELAVVCRAKNMPHAIKITNEHRVRLIAENKWNVDSTAKEVT